MSQSTADVISDVRGHYDVPDGPVTGSKQQEWRIQHGTERDSWITKCGSKLIYKTLPGKEVVYVLPITSILGRLPVVWAGDTGTIPFSYHNGCSTSNHSYDHTLAKADTSAGARDGCHMYFVNSWALGWSRDQ